MRFSGNGTLLLKGRPLSGPIVVDEWATPMTFRNARNIASSPFDELALPGERPGRALRDRLLPRRPAQAGSIHIWPAHGGGTVQGRLSFRLRAPNAPATTVTVQTSRSHGLLSTIKVAPGASREVTLDVCTTGRWDFGFRADRTTMVDDRSISLAATAPVWRPDASVCT